MATENVLYAFGRSKIAIIEPNRAEVVGEIRLRHDDVDWSNPLVTHDHRLIFVNDRRNARVVVVDAAEGKIVDEIGVGARPVHLYNPLGGPEIWTHCDGEGAFYVIEVATLKVVATLVAALNNSGHGKLLYHETLGDKGYATNSSDPAVFGIDLTNKRVVRTIEVAEGRAGTHGKAYSPHNGHAYFECTGIGKTAVVDTASDSILKYLDAAGQPFSSPDGRLTALADRRNNRVHVIDATEDSEIVASIPVDGAPDKVYFSEQDSKLYGFTANTLTPDAAVIDFHEMRVIERVVLVGNAGVGRQLCEPLPEELGCCRATLRCLHPVRWGHSWHRRFRHMGRRARHAGIGHPGH